MGRRIPPPKPGRPKKTIPVYVRFQENFRALLESGGHKHDFIAERMGWPNANYVSQVLNGHRGVSLENIQALADILQVDPGDFFCRVDSRKKVREFIENMPIEYKASLRNNPKYAELLSLVKESVDRFTGPKNGDGN